MSEEALEIIHALKSKNEELKQANESLTCQHNEANKENELLREQINDLLRRLYGRKSERFENPAQLDLAKLLNWIQEKPEERPRDLEQVEYTRKRPQKPGPKPLPDHLLRETVNVDPPAEERVCACCSEDMERVDEVVTEELDVVPPQFRIKRYVQGKWRCRECMNRDKVEPLPARPIKKGRPSPSLLAYIIVSKYLDHLPLNRQEEIFKRHSIHLRRSTMNDWLGQVSELLRPIVESMKRELLGGSFLQVDETPIQAMDRRLEGKTRRCYLWAYGRPYDEVVYDVTESRAARGPKAFLNGYSGYLQADGYPGFRELFRSGEIRHISCMAHIRRKFVEAEHAAPERVAEILSIIRALYAIEREAKEEGLTKEARVKLRRERSSTILAELKRRIDELAPIPVPKSKLGRAVTYAMGQWPTMERYLEVGEAEIDNNASERAIKPAVIGRKNYLFLGSVKGGGERAEVFYSLTQSAKRLGINPFEYLRDVLERIPTQPEAHVLELGPRHWKRTHRTTENVSVGTSR